MKVDASRFAIVRKAKKVFYSPKVAGRLIYLNHRVKEGTKNIGRRLPIHRRHSL